MVTINYSSVVISNHLCYYYYYYCYHYYYYYYYYLLLLILSLLLDRSTRTCRVGVYYAKPGIFVGYPLHCLVHELAPYNVYV